MARLFWIVAGAGMLVLLALAADTVVNPHGQFAGLVFAMFLAGLLLLGVIMVGVALIRRPVAYWIGLALVIWPPVYWAVAFVGPWVMTPAESSLPPGTAISRALPSGRWRMPSWRAMRPRWQRWHRLRAWIRWAGTG